MVAPNDAEKQHQDWRLNQPRLIRKLRAMCVASQLKKGGPQYEENSLILLNFFLKFVKFFVWDVALFAEGIAPAQGTINKVNSQKKSGMIWWRLTSSALSSSLLKV